MKGRKNIDWDLLIESESALQLVGLGREDDDFKPADHFKSLNGNAKMVIAVSKVAVDMVPKFLRVHSGSRYVYPLPTLDLLGDATGCAGHGLPGAALRYIGQMQKKQEIAV